MNSACSCNVSEVMYIGIRMLYFVGDLGRVNLPALITRQRKIEMAVEIRLNHNHYLH